MSGELWAPFALLTVTIISLLVSLFLGARTAVRTFRAWRWNRAQAAHYEEVQDHAIALNEVITELVALDRRVNHYRHNVHCPTCGRFSRQADGWPSGVAACNEHGIGIRTTLTTGAIAVVLAPVGELAELAIAEPADFILEAGRDLVPDDITALLELERS